MTKSSINLMPDIKIDRLIRSKRRTIALEITVEGQIIVRAPNRWSLKDIYAFVDERSAWVRRKLLDIKSIPPVPKKQYLPGEEFLYLGSSYPLQIVEPNTVPFRFDSAFKIANDHQKFTQLLLFGWYRQQAKLILTERIAYYANLHGYTYQRVILTNAKRRWGSCNSKGELRFNWRLIMAPQFVIDYVVAHELAHLKQMNHSHRFWQLVSAMLPDYLHAKKWLKVYGHKLIF